MVTMVSLPTGYLLRVGPPSVSAYLYLREATGMSPKTHQQALAGIDGAWAAVHVIHAPTGETVAMGRVIGDGGWYFHIIDMAVLPEHQRQGLGDTILTWLLDRIRQDAPRTRSSVSWRTRPGAASTNDTDSRTVHRATWE